MYELGAEPYILRIVHWEILQRIIDRVFFRVARKDLIKIAVCSGIPLTLMLNWNFMFCLLYYYFVFPGGIGV